MTLSSFLRLFVVLLFGIVHPAWAGLVITSSQNLTLVEEGGTIQSGNLATAGTAFAQDEIGVAPHAIAKVNDGTFGNSSSWIAGTTWSFVGISLGSTAVLVNQIAFGRDNTGTYADRWLGAYELQYTTVANPSESTPEASWTTLGTLEYQSAGGTNFATPAKRHRFTFDPVFATGFRLRIYSGPELIGVDEMEIYPMPLPTPTLVTTGGSFLAGNLATAVTSTAFAKDVIGTSTHATANLRDGTYGNDNSWIGGSADSFIGIRLGSTPVAVKQLAFGRDNTGTQTDRHAGVYTFQYTTVPNPDETTPEASWTSFAQVSYPLAGDATPALRHLFSFATVNATGIRLRVQSAGDLIAVDELELYPPLADASLASLTSSAGALSPVFAEATTTYTLPDVPYATNSITVTPTVNHGAAIVKVNDVAAVSGSPFSVSLLPGVNVITVLVTAENGTTTRSYTLTITRELGMTLVEEGGSAGTPNIARESVITATSEVNTPHHGAALANDGVYGDASSWIAEAANSAVVVNLGPDIVNVSGIAWGRDNSGTLTNRWRGRYIIEYTQAETPGTLTPDAEWLQIAEVDYATLLQTGNFSTPARRHRWSFPPVQARGIRVRVITAAGEAPIAMDELEIYTSGPWLQVEHIVNTPLQRGAPPIQWGPTVIRKTVTSNFKVRNVGSATLTDLTWNGGGSGYTTNLMGTTIPAGGSVDLQVTFEPLSLGSYPFEYTLISTATTDKPRSFLIRVHTQVNCDGFYVLDPRPRPFALGVPIDYNAIDVRGVSHPDSHPGMQYVPAYGVPGGLTFYSYGRLAGTPTETGRFLFFTLASDALGCSPGSSIIRHWRVMKVAWTQEGGAMLPRNIAVGKPAFAKDNLGIAPHAPDKVNDGVFGNASSWIAGSKNSFIGINLGATPLTLNKVAFGRDNTQQFYDRREAIRTLQYTTTPNPDGSTPDAEWITLDVINFNPDEWGDHALPQNHAARLLFSFAPIQATGFRIRMDPPHNSPFYDQPANFMAVDEIELYGPDPTPGWRTQHFGAATTNTGDLDDYDGDGLKNLLEFALGTLPANARRGPLSHSGNVITPGDPISDGTNALFIRRRDYISAGITYTVEFSPDLTTWTSSTAISTVLADDGTHEVVRVPMPASQTRHFFRVKVQVVP